MKNVYKTKERTIYKNRNGKIVQFTDYWGGVRYCLFDPDGNYIKDLPLPFCVGDYL